MFISKLDAVKYVKIRKFRPLFWICGSNRTNVCSLILFITQCKGLLKLYIYNNLSNCIGGFVGIDSRRLEPLCYCQWWSYAWANWTITRGSPTLFYALSGPPTQVYALHGHLKFYYALKDIKQFVWFSDLCFTYCRGS